MKRSIYVLMLLLFAGCTAELKDVTGNRSENHVFTADFESFETKVYADLNLQTHWTADDRISIFSNTYNKQYKFDGQTGDDNGTFSPISNTFSTGNEIPANYAVYPYSESTKITSGGELTLTMPAVQNYFQNSYGLEANTMVAVTKNLYDFNLTFKSLCGYVVVQLYGEGTVKSISLTGNNGEKIAGEATVTPVYGESPSVVMSDKATTTITIDCGEGVELGNTPQGATSFWFAIPPVTFSKGFTIVAKDVDNRLMKVSTSISRTVSRNVKNALSPLEATFDLSKEYVDMGLSVKWATCNLGATEPEKYGYYFSWGETRAYTNSTYNGVGKNNNGKDVLDLKDDAANVFLGEQWRIPTAQEWEELVNNCNFVWEARNGVYGYTVTSKKAGYESSSIFLPACGFWSYGTFYQASTVFSGDYYGDYVTSTTASKEFHFTEYRMELDSWNVYDARSIRPVYGNMN